MEHNSSKVWQVILGIIVIVIIGFIIKKSTTHAPVVPVTPSGPDTSTIEDPNIVATQLCYIWNTEAGDKAQLSMDIRGSNVIGEFNWLPAEKDSKTGIFKGTVGPVDQMTMARTVIGWWDVSAEGTKVTEEIRIKFGDGVAGVGFGEMKDRGDGTYVYANPNNLSYAPNLSQTDCGDNAMD